MYLKQQEENRSVGWKMMWIQAKGSTYSHTSNQVAILEACFLAFLAFEWRKCYENHLELIRVQILVSKVGKNWNESEKPSTWEADEGAGDTVQGTGDGHKNQKTKWEMVYQQLRSIQGIQGGGHQELRMMPGLQKTPHRGWETMHGRQTGQETAHTGDKRQHGGWEKR
ncbi:hypothetical protein B0H10DRAFT_1951389 [Mycena sp. CBHHK59/15]|nr:hypothetical protein B0H10DRAFT_1951389 [Mycena sp. CBHHK59/15]